MAAPVMIKDSPLAPVPAEDPLTKDQWRTLLAIADAVVPTVVEKRKGKESFSAVALESKEYAAVVAELEQHTQDADLAVKYLKERPSQNPVFKESLWRLFGENTPKDLVKLMALVLNLLNYRASSLLLTGYPSAFADQPVAVREAILLSWSQAYIPIYRQLYKQLTALVKQTWIRTSPTVYSVLKFPRVPVHGKPTPGFEYDFIQIPPGSDAEVIETDVVVVGSGCGSGPIAKNLAEAGNRVLVVDKAYHWPTDHLPMTEDSGWGHLFMNGGALFTDDSSVAIVAGATWGGGGTVNWSASLQTQGFVRREWAEQDGLRFFTSSEFQDCLDTICKRMGVSSAAITHNKANDILLEGSRRLGWAAKPVPQNTGGKQHYCGYCTFGCASCEKQGPIVSWLPDAARAGAKFMEGFDVQKVLFEERGGRKIATGVEGIWSSRDEHGSPTGKPLTRRKVVVKAKRVVISAGTMQSPLILMRSGLKNKWIGRNLRLHPVTFVGGVYEEEIRPWEGGILTAVVNEFENLDGKGHGAKVEAAVGMPTALLSFSTWTGGVNYKLFAPRLRHMVAHFSMARDEGSGYVYPDRADGRPRVVFTPSKADRKHIIEGLVAAAKINYIMGAKELFTTVPGVPSFKRSDAKASSDNTNDMNDPAFNAWLDIVRKRGVPDPDTVFVSAHQMGTCKMSNSPSKGVVDPKGRVWEVDEGLYVADASVFPSASGVNPMVTNMGISEWISRNLVKGLKANDSVQAVL
ncbi:uncharacterized protein PV09_04043 [Verruconis gallopava]|uniref:Long-chain-alcohol oxidase n=1 Tax=Verruconis gallopava TaxID=253628 RepID=A0A0D1XQG0_9PEZI|nr:uncharacterized protein PV09_04043 [Verruconis gallopava]KIW04861.1 hypothetical protein PV09_04043 [Verruconis gallopava]